MADMTLPRPCLVDDDVRYRTCTCGCHQIHHNQDGVCRFYEECGCEGMVPELVVADVTANVAA